MGPKVKKRPVKSPTPDDGSPLLSLPFDHYQRYHLTQRIVSLLMPRRKYHPLRILDVGGSSSSLKLFLPEDEVVLADVQDPPPFTYREGVPFLYDAYFLAAGGQLPFADAGFDLVTAHDTLEHVPNDLRPAFLRDLLRVARRFVVLNGPEFHPDVAGAEQRLALLLERTELGDNISLNEHLDWGLPDKELVEGVLREQELPFTDIPNGNLGLWLSMMGVKHYITSLPHSDKLHEAIDRIYNALVSPGDFGGLCYRRAYVIAKRPRDANVLRRIETAFADDLSQPAPKWDVRAVERILDTMEDHARGVRRDLVELRALLAQRAASLQQQNGVLTEKDALLAEKGALLTEKDALLAEKDTLLTEKDTSLAEKDTSLAEKDALLTEKESRIASSEATLVEREEQLRVVRQQLHGATNTVGFRLLERARAVINWLAPLKTRRRSVLRLFGQGLRIILSEGWGTFLRRAVPVWKWAPRRIRRAKLAAQLGPLDEQYQQWLRAHALTRARIRRVKKEAANFSYRPKVSIVMPVYNPDPRWLRDAIESVRGQLYDNWQLSIADDASTKPEVRALLQEYQSDERIKVAYLKKNQGISGASNAALAMARGEFVGLLDHDDELKPDALYEVVKLLNEQPDLDFIYSDEDKRDEKGALISPFFKPDWSPDLEYSSNYVTHFAVYRRQIVERVGGFRKGYEGSQDYDLALRVTELTDKLGHVRKVLYTWRMVPGSVAANAEAKPYAHEAAKKALAESLERRGIDAWVEPGRTRGWYRIRYPIKRDPMVSVIIPTRDAADLLRNCLNKIEESRYKRVEVIVVDNGSVEKATRALLRSRKLKVVRDDEPFNFSRLINAGAAAARGDFLLLLNNDVEAINEDWIEAMLEHAQRPEVGVVGARLLFPGDGPQHEGVALGMGGTFAAHLDWRDYLGLSHALRNCSAVTAACAMSRRSVFEELGGFDERFRVAYGDVDYCLRARDRGYLVVYTPYALLYHYQSASRGPEHPPEDERLARRRWGHLTDPYYNYALDEVLKPWVFGPAARVD